MLGNLHRYSLACLLLISSKAAYAGFSKPESVPEWFRTAAHQTLPPLPSESRAVVLLDETTYTVAPDGQATEHCRHVTKILRPQGRRDATIEVEYDRDTKILSLHVWSIAADGREYAMKDAGIAADIFQNRYGDCKDKAAMLSAVGVHAALVMVDTHRGVIDPEAPSIVGNHMIAAIEIPTGHKSSKLNSVVTAATGRRYLIFDPTWEKTPFGQIESNLQGGFGVLMEGPDSQILALPVLSPQLNTMHRTGSFQLQADETLSGTVAEKQFGDLSEPRRRMATEGGTGEQAKFLDHALEHDFSTFKTADVKMENMQALHADATVSYNLTAEHFARTMGSLLMLRPRVLGIEDFQADQRPRTVPINLGQSMRESDNYEIVFPAGYAIDEIPAPINLDLGFPKRKRP